MAITKLAVYQMALRHLGDARLALITDDVESRYALDDAWERATNFVLGQAPWRFALITGNLSVIASAMPGYTHGAFLPVESLRPHAIFIATGDGRECPFDFREQGGAINFNRSGTPVLRYISNTFAEGPWPEHFAQTLAAYLAFLVAYRVTGDSSAAGKMSQLFSSLLPEAVRIDAVEEDFWLPYQRSGEFLRAARHVIEGGNFDFSLKTLQIDVSTQETTPADVGWPYHFTRPSDHVRTQGLWINWGGIQCPFDIRETSLDWSTATQAFTVSYVSSDGFDSTLWPEAVTKAVAAYLEWEGEGADEDAKAQQAQLQGAEFQALYKAAVDRYGIADSPWLRFQLNGSYIQAVHQLLERGRWRFAVKTVSLEDSQTTTSITYLTADDGVTILTDDSGNWLTTDEGETAVPGDLSSVSDGSVSAGYTMRLPQPNDWLRTIRLYKSWSDGLSARWDDIDFRHELQAFHTNYSPCILRYVSQLGLDATQWPQNFRDAVMAWLEHVEARADPKMAALAKAKLDLFQLASQEAQNLDDESDVPKMSQGGRFVQARYGRGNFSRENAIPFP